jgi:Flp pilus assembly protein TadG
MHRQRGQILVIFVIAVVAIIGMVGLVLDGGSAFAQRREEQNVADLAAIAGATAHLNTSGDSATKLAAADAAAQSIATANGYTNGVGNVVVTVGSSSNTFAATVQVTITKPHRNNFAAIMGMPTWPVSVTATAISTDSPNAAVGVMPLLFNEDAFPGAICNEETENCASKIETYQLPGTGNEDVPQDATQFNWTVFCVASGNPCNANSDLVKDIIGGDGTDGADPIDLGYDIGPLNAGTHADVFFAMEAYTGGVFPVPVVDDDGNMVGFAYFKLIAIEGSPDKVIKGYFVSPVNADKLVIDTSAPAASLETGVYRIKLTN